MSDDPARRARENDRHPLSSSERADLRAMLEALADDPAAAAELVHGRTDAPPGPLSDLVRTVARAAAARLAVAPPPVLELELPTPRAALDDAPRAAPVGTSVPSPTLSE